MSTKDERKSFREFTEDTSLHGVKFISREDLGKIQRAIWAVLVIALLTGLLSLLGYSLYTYYQYESITTTTTKTEKTMLMPAVTVCPNYYVSKQSTKRNYKNVTFDVYDTLIPIIEGRVELEAVATDEIMDFLHKETVTEFYYKTAFQDIFVLCGVNEERVNCSNYLQITLTEHGICYTFHGLAVASKFSPIYSKAPVKTQLFRFVLYVEKEETLEASFGEGHNVVIHHPLSFPMTRQNSFKVAPGFETYIGLTMYENEYLKPPYSKQECVNQEDLNSTYERYEYGGFYSPEKCYVLCYNDQVYNTGCSFTREVSNNSCTMYEFMKYALNNLNTIEHVFLEKCKYCLPLCHKKGYDMSISYARYPNTPAVKIAKQLNLTYTTKEGMAENYAALNIYFESFNKKITIQQPSQSIENLLSQVGGMMGLCLGASILTGVEWLQYLVSVLYGYFTKINNHNKKTTKIDVKSNYY